MTLGIINVALLLPLALLRKLLAHGRQEPLGNVGAMVDTPQRIFPPHPADQGSGSSTSMGRRPSIPSAVGVRLHPYMNGLR